MVSLVILQMVPHRADLQLAPWCRPFHQGVAGVVTKTQKKIKRYSSLFHTFDANDLAIRSVKIIFTKHN